MYTATMSAKGWLVIPKDLRDKYGLKTGSHVQVIDYDGSLSLVPLPEDPIAALYGMLQDGPSLTAELLKERARERAREDSRDE